MGADELALYQIHQQITYTHAEELVHKLSQEHDMDPPTHSLPEQAAGGGGGVSVQSVPPRLLRQILIKVDDDG